MCSKEKKHHSEGKVCDGINHDLTVIYRNNVGYNEVHVVQWCKNCGAVVVDSESDGRIFPGNVKKMIFPTSYFQPK